MGNQFAHIRAHKASGHRTGIHLGAHHPGDTTAAQRLHQPHHHAAPKPRAEKKARKHG